MHHSAGTTHLGISNQRGTTIISAPRNTRSPNRVRLGLYQVAHAFGEVGLDPKAKNVYAVEHIAVDATKAQAIARTTAQSPGFQGALVFGSDDGTASVLVYQFEHPSEFEVAKTFG